MSESNQLLDAITQLVSVVARLDAKLDAISAPAAPAAEPAKPIKKRGRPKKTQPKPKPKSEPEHTFEPVLVEEDEDDDDDDDSVYRSNDKRLAMSSGIQLGKRVNIFDTLQINVAAVPEDKKAMNMLKTGKLKISTRRPAIKIVSIRCSNCHQKYKLPESAITPSSLEDNKWFCNTCSGSGA